MYFDWTYLVLVLPMLIITMIAQGKVTSTYNKYSKVISRRGWTAEQAVRQILAANGLHDVTITRVAGNLTDHYDPRTNSIALSDTVYGSRSIAAIGVAAHEAGHAIQHAVGYFPIKVRTAIVPLTQFGSRLSTPLLILGLLLGFYPLAYSGILLFGVTTVFQLVTLPTEYNASRRALEALEGGYLDEDELKGTKKVLSAAASTYLAALFVSLASLLRLILIVNGRRRD
ncbi:MAG: zinc metallopeptidase [Ruminococcaceae bacterium]|nr:zinc metallopeptidase [Oscillospiraceae bacterium]